MSSSLALSTKTKLAGTTIIGFSIGTLGAGGVIVGGIITLGGAGTTLESTPTSIVNYEKKAAFDQNKTYQVPKKETIEGIKNALDKEEKFHLNNPSLQCENASIIYEKIKKEKQRSLAMQEPGLYIILPDNLLFKLNKNEQNIKMAQVSSANYKCIGNFDLEAWKSSLLEDNNKYKTAIDTISTEISKTAQDQNFRKVAILKDHELQTIIEKSLRARCQDHKSKNNGQ